MRINKFILMASTAFATSISVAQAEISVIASIKPVHSLVAGVMKGRFTKHYCRWGWFSALIFFKAVAG